MVHYKRVSNQPLNLNIFLDPKLQLMFLFIIFLFFKVYFISSHSLYLSRFIFIFLFLYVVYCSIIQYFLVFKKNINYFNIFVTNSLFLFIFIFLFTKTYLTYLFFIELFSIYYYFFFLNIFTKLYIHNLYKYKSFILYYIWNSYLTTLFFGIGVLGLSYYFGSLDFYFLSFFKSNNVFLLLLFVSLCWKLGMPAFHYLKLQIYRYLDCYNLFFFSVYSLLFNLFLFVYFLIQPSTIIFLNYFPILSIIIIFFLSIVMTYFNITSLYQFFSFSSIVTLVTIMITLLTY